MHDHDPDDAELRAWLAGGKAPHGVCPHCGSRISVVQRDGQFTARCSHRGCGASGPRMATLVRAVEQFCAPPAYVARHMGISVHPSSLTDVVSVLEHDRDAALARAEQAEAERDEARAMLRTATEALAECAPRSLLTDARAERDLEAKLKGEALYQAELEANRATKAEAEVARLRGQRESALREAAGVCYELARTAHSMAWVNAADECKHRILALLDAPAAKGGE